MVMLRKRLTVTSKERTSLQPSPAVDNQDTGDLVDLRSDNNLQNVLYLFTQEEDILCDCEAPAKHQPQHGRQHRKSQLADVHQETQEAQEMPCPVTLALSFRELSNFLC